MEPLDEAAVAAARARLAERGNKADASFKAWKATAEPRYRKLKAQEQSALEAEARQRAEEEARRRHDHERRRQIGHQALREQRRRDAERLRQMRDERDRRLRKQQAVEAEAQRAMREARREQAERRARLDEAVVVHATRMRKAMCLAELKARVPTLLARESLPERVRQSAELASQVSVAADDGDVPPALAPIPTFTV